MRAPLSAKDWPQLVAYVLAMWFVVRPWGIRLALACSANAGGAIDASRQARLTVAFEALGPERVARGLAATGHSWNDCFLARATDSAPDALRRTLRQWWPGRTRAPAAFVGAAPEVAREVLRSWDRNEGAFRQLALEWLEHHRSDALPGARRVLNGSGLPLAAAGKRGG